MDVLIILIVVVVLSAIIGAVSQVLKNQQQAEQARAARDRAADRAGGADRREGRASSDIDRFLEEIDKLRRKSAGGAAATPAGPAAAPVARRVNRPAALPEVPTVEPARKPRVAGDPTFAAPAAPVARAVPTSHPVAAPLPRIEDLPVAPVVGPPAAYTPSVVTRPKMLADPRPAKKTEFAAQLATLLGTRNAVPMAVVLQEVLGPPKCKRG
jgi:hypothetical protein